MKRLYFLLIIILIASSADAQKGLFVHIPMDERVEDIVNENNKVILHGTHPTTDRFGKENSALEFFGREYVEIVNPNLLKPTTSTLSISIWVKVEHKSWRGMRILDKADAGKAPGITIDTYGNNGTTIRYVAGNTAVISNEPIQFKEWMHIVFTFDKGQKTIYINGKESITGTSRVDYIVDQANFPLLLGKSQGVESRGEYFTGCMDDLRMYTSVLSAKGVLKLYKEGGYAPIIKSQEERAWKMGDEEHHVATEEKIKTGGVSITGSISVLDSSGE